MTIIVNEKGMNYSNGRKRKKEIKIVSRYMTHTITRIITKIINRKKTCIYHMAKKVQVEITIRSQISLWYKSYFTGMSHHGWITNSISNAISRMVILVLLFQYCKLFLTIIIIIICKVIEKVKLYNRIINVMYRVINYS